MYQNAVVRLLELLAIEGPDDEAADEHDEDVRRDDQVDRIARRRRVADEAIRGAVQRLGGERDGGRRLARLFGSVRHAGPPLGCARTVTPRLSGSLGRGVCVRSIVRTVPAREGVGHPLNEAMRPAASTRIPQSGRCACAASWLGCRQARTDRSTGGTRWLPKACPRDAADPGPPGPGLTTFDAKDPETAFPPIEPLLPPDGAPNVLVILIDDVGFGASSAFGGPCATPNAERLAAGGLRYNRFHTTALCAPTRQALLTGRNHHSVGMGGITRRRRGPPATIRCPNTRVPSPRP